MYCSHQVSESDLLPHGVCVQCAHTLLAWSELVECSRDADRALRTRLAQLQLVAQQVRFKQTFGCETILLFQIAAVATVLTMPLQTMLDPN